MYRKRNGSLGFSFTRFANAAVPNFFADETPSRTVDLTGYRRDMCYMHQIASANPYTLDERSFYVAGVVDAESVSRKVYAKLKKNEILKEDGLVDTHKIGPKFPHQLALLNIYRQKDLVGMLFWWEEECQRLRKLDAEEMDLDALISESEIKLTKTEEDSAEQQCVKETLDQLKFARERVRMKRRQRPSQRDPEVEADRDDIIMAFHGRSKSVPNVGVNAMATSSERPIQQGQPPQYFAGP
ncbi:uncharacterized protein Z519_11092 [Cladophialophora bantiana CBS 173.52]|uniref:Uncharacterized protein n=1 Tax=Cladophialophora bantiana (strain ATCC 10958 / CBS 173.52 / CDC B-1940 / NIH 8579) TaxID=1442370 RepID=A0A0D2H5H6_CLAB1|nr:uncharacterized protein Z519_11092 [Cladophialophora bantiana CBS 173.52]KIW88523.1 hypothetical protein Z519_11092 [Cladophialophora bantiana CBS 173.52]